jgi:hypothetical protein
VAKDDAFLLLQPLARDVLIEVSLVLQHFAGGPARCDRHLGDAGILVVEQQFQLVGDRENANPVAEFIALDITRVLLRFLLAGWRSGA